MKECLKSISNTEVKFNVLNQILFNSMDIINKYIHKILFKIAFLVVREWNDIKKPFSVVYKDFVIDFCFGIYTQSILKLVYLETSTY